MIIGINGKIGSGKDTVGKIIQFLVLESKIKTGLPFNNQELPNSGWEIKKFAGKLKQVASLLTGIPIGSFEDQEFKKSYLGSEWGTVKTNPLNSIPVFKNVGFNQLMSVRELLQKLGTEAMRDGLHINVWVNALFADYKYEDDYKLRNYKLFKGQEISKEDITQKYPNWIITDMRFPNEMEVVVEREGITIRVVRPVENYPENSNFNGDMQIAVKMSHNHPSETALDDSKFDYEIINDGSIEDLVEKVKEILTIEKLI
jgi:hypothetical protein